MNIEQSLKKAIQEALLALFQVEEEVVLQPTKKDFEGNYTYVVFPLVKSLRKNPAELGNAIGQFIQDKNDFVSSFNVVQGFLNIVLNNSVEAQITELEELEDKLMFLEEYGLTESGLDKLIRSSYHLLNLITYFTAGVQEVRAWTIQKGWKAPAAAGVIHTDFERGFIRAEVIKLADYVAYKTEAGCKDAGKLSVEGKEYVVQDGDIMHFRFNV